jgi:uncharacterized protein DUF87
LGHVFPVRPSRYLPLWLVNKFNFNQNIYLGAYFDGQLVALERDARMRHLYIVGQTGTGKSTLLLNLLMQDLANERGCALLDPHGDLAEAALGFLPTRRGDDLVYLNPADLDHPIGFNLLGNVPDDLRPLVADGVVAAFRHVWPEFWGPRLEHIFAHSVRTLMDVPNATLLHLPRLLQDEVYRASVLPFIKDPVNAAFWNYEYASYPARFREEAIAPVLNKIGRVLMTPAIRNIIAQPKSTIDLRFIMDNERVLIANLSKGTLGEGPSHLLGALLVTAFAQAALSRSSGARANSILMEPKQGTKSLSDRISESDNRDHLSLKRADFHLYVDEFQSFATSGFSLILSEARKYGLSLTLAHQYLDQLPDSLREAVFGNAGSMIALRVGADDAGVIARQLCLPNPQMLRDLQNFEAWANVLKNGQPTDPFLLVPHPPSKPFHCRGHKLIKNSAIRFGRDRAIVEKHIARFYDA